MKLLITGAKGMLAKEVIEIFKNNNELILTDVSELDITNKQNVDDFISKNKPDVIINCAAFTAVDKAETAGEIAEKINAIGPMNLAIAAKNNNEILVHISTDYVFGGNLDISKAHKEDDIKEPVTAYGITKLHGEQNIENNTDKYYIFRTAWLYGIGGHNFVKTMLKLGNEHDEVSVVDDQHGSPTYAKDLAEVIYKAVTMKIPYGVYNATNEGFTTWADFTRTIFKYANINCKVNSVSTEEYIEMMKVTQAIRPKNSQLSKEKLASVGIKFPNWQDGLKRYLEEEKNSAV